MKIYKSVLDSLVFAPPTSPIEVGGILGGTDGIIKHFLMDDGINSVCGYGTYIPDTTFLNENIRNWSEHGIAFYGIFHSHYPISAQLSASDKRYISKIMEALFPQITELYFPIVIPHHHITAYRACINSDGVQIFCDKIETL